MKKISVFGDSLVYGMGDSVEGGWVTRLQEKLGSGFVLQNFGIPGDHSRDLLERMEEECEDSDIIVISIGANDSQYINNPEETLIDIEEFKDNLREIVKIAKKYTKEIIFVGLPRMNESITTKWDFKYYFCNENLKKYDREIESFCEKNNIPYIQISDLLTHDDLSDGAHPNEFGYQKIADRVDNQLGY